MIEMRFRGFLFAVSFSLLAQVPGSRFEALKDALGLSDFQLSQIQQSRPAANAMADVLADRILDDSQKAKLAVIEKVLHSDKMASLAIVAGLIDAKQWPKKFPCGYYPFRTSASELGLSDSQMGQLEQLQRAEREPVLAQAKQKQNQRMELLRSSVSADSPAVVQLTSEMEKLGRQAENIWPQRDSTLAILDGAQKAKLAAFEMVLQLAREAIELRLIILPPEGEVLCP